MIGERFTPPAIWVNVYGGVMTNVKDPTYRKLVVAVSEDSIFMSGDWPDGTDKAKMAHDIVAAIKANLPDEEGNRW